MEGPTRLVIFIFNKGDEWVETSSRGDPGRDMNPVYMRMDGLSRGQQLSQVEEPKCPEILFTSEGSMGQELGDT